MCSPALLRDPRRPLKRPQDLSQHTLLTVDLPNGDGVMMDWGPWLALMDLDRVTPSSTMRFTQYAEAVAAAVAGQGVVIGRLPLLASLLKTRQLVTPFRSGASSRRGYFVEVAAHAADNADAQDFVRWLLHEARVAAVG
jgi:LysR family transcriptional regulator, glycine cleavage system transcriptional activator